MPFLTVQNPASSSKTFSMTCHYNLPTLRRVRWYHTVNGFTFLIYTFNKSSLQEDQREGRYSTLSADTESHRLLIDDISHMDQGHYSCETETTERNRARSAAVFVYVTGKPDQLQYLFM